MLDNKQVKKKRTFTNEFKREACRLVIEEGQKISVTAKNLGIGQALLGRWVKEYRTESRKPTGVKEAERRVKELEAEVRLLQMEREILKKAMAYFVKSPK